MPTVFHVCIQDSFFLAEGWFCPLLNEFACFSEFFFVSFLKFAMSKFPWGLPGSIYSKDSSECFLSLSPWWCFLDLPLICEGHSSSFLSVKICLCGVCSQINLPWDLSPWSTCLGSWWSLIILPRNKEKKELVTRQNNFLNTLILVFFWYSGKFFFFYVSFLIQIRKGTK